MDCESENKKLYDKLAGEFDVIQDRLLELVQASEAALPHVNHDDALERLHKAIVATGLQSF